MTANRKGIIQAMHTSLPHLEFPPPLGQRDPDAGAEPFDDPLAVQSTSNEDNLVDLRLALLPRVVAGPVADCFMHALKDELLVLVPLRGNRELNTNEPCNLSSAILNADRN